MISGVDGSMREGFLKPGLRVILGRLLAELEWRVLLGEMEAEVD